MKNDSWHKNISLLIKPLEPLLESFAKRKLTYDKQVDEPKVVFIVGAPRSGTTLLFQVITHSLNIAFPNNLTALFPNAPRFGTWLGELLNITRPHKSFRSVHGFPLDDGFRGPNEWEDFYRHNIFEILQKQSESLYVLCKLKSVLRFSEGHSQKIFVLKCLNATLHIDTLSSVFPNAKFLAIERNTKAVVKSIKIAKEKENKPSEEIWYVSPPELLTATFNTEEEQIYTQVCAINKRITDALEFLEEDKILKVSYEELCKSPIEIAEKIRQWLTWKVEWRPDMNLPKDFLN